VVIKGANDMVGPMLNLRWKDLDKAVKYARSCMKIPRQEFYVYYNYDLKAYMVTDIKPEDRYYTYDGIYHTTEKEL
jgi:hypothetical protein